MSSPVNNRISFESKIMSIHLPYIKLYRDRFGFCFAGRYTTTSGGRTFRLKLSLSYNYPEEMPNLYVVDPILLRTHDFKGNINSKGISHSFHTRTNGPGGCVQICHFSPLSWDSSKTCIGVMVKALLWLEAYSTYLATGINIADILEEWTRR